jgi:DNA polymerase alpha-associated DNA helicase A
MDKAINQLEKTILPSVRISVIDYTDHADRLQGDGKSSGQLTPLIQVLLAMKSPSPKERIENLTFFDTSLNDSQKVAVRFCLESPEVACIHGPPGI